MFFFFSKYTKREYERTETIRDRRGLFTLPHCFLQSDLIRRQHIFPNSTVWLTIFELPHDDVRWWCCLENLFFDTKKDTQKSLEELKLKRETPPHHYHRMRMDAIVPLCHSENPSFSNYFSLKLTLLLILLLN